MTEWTTLLDPAKCQAAGIEAPWHQVCFLPKSDNILGRCISLLIPECELQYIVAAAAGPPVGCINKPRRNRSVRHWLKLACQKATEEDCPLFFSCDTREQAEQAATFAAKRLLHQQRAALERMYDPATRTIRGLM